MSDQPITEADLARLDALCAAATEGPWIVQKPSWNRQGTPFKTAITSASGTVANAFTKAAWRGGFPQDQPGPSDTARFIAESRTALPSLIAALRVAWRERDAAREALEPFARVADRFPVESYPRGFDFSGVGECFTLGQIRAARAALADPKGATK